MMGQSMLQCCWLLHPQRGPVVILVDALDEAEGGCSIDNPLLRLLQDHVSRLPEWVRLIITSRPEAHIVRALRAKFMPLEIAQDDPRHLTDLRHMLTRHLEAHMDPTQVCETKEYYAQS